MEPDSTPQRELEKPGMQNHPPPLMKMQPNLFRAPGPEPRVPVGATLRPRGPIVMGFGPREPNPGLELPKQVNHYVSIPNEYP